MQEGMDLLNKMKTMPGMGNMQQMFSQMGIPGLGKGAKMNMGAMEAQMNRNMKTAKMKERMKARAEINKERSATAFCNMSDSNPSATATAIPDEEIVKIFSTGEKVEKTPRGAKPPSAKKKKGKK
jgi:spore coat protein CotH